MREILAIDPEAVIFIMSGRDEGYQEVARMLGAKRGFRKAIPIDALLRGCEEARFPARLGKIALSMSDG